MFVCRHAVAVAVSFLALALFAATAAAQPAKGELRFIALNRPGFIGGSLA